MAKADDKHTPEQRALLKRMSDPDAILWAKQQRELIENGIAEAAELAEARKAIHRANDIRDNLIAPPWAEKLIMAVTEKPSEPETSAPAQSQGLDAVPLNESSRTLDAPALPPLWASFEGYPAHRALMMLTDPQLFPEGVGTRRAKVVHNKLMDAIQPYPHIKRWEEPTTRRAMDRLGA